MREWQNYPPPFRRPDSDSNAFLDLPIIHNAALHVIELVFIVFAAILFSCISGPALTILTRLFVGSRDPSAQIER